MPICQKCEKDFESSRADARYCSAKCRVAASRNKTPVTDVTDVTDNRNTGAEHVTDKLPAGLTRNKPEIPAAPKELHLIAAHVHDFHPHVHVMMTDGPFKGKRKKCSGRWWCRSCNTWSDGKTCHTDMG